MKNNDVDSFNEKMRCRTKAAARGRSEAEFYSKICIVVEECDESVFWIE